MMGAEGPAFNLYSEGAWDLQLPSGVAPRVEAETNYPFSGAVDLVLHPRGRHLSRYACEYRHGSVLTFA